jgi:hypothetical protein
MPTKKLSCNIWFMAVRKSEYDGHEWIDVCTWGVDAEWVMKIVAKNDLKLPDWAKAHPVLRVTQVEIREVSPESDLPSANS